MQREMRRNRSVGMQFPRPYRHDPRFIRRRLERIAGQFNDVLVVFAFGLAALDLVLAAQRVAEAVSPLPAAVVALH